jgi:putative inorganic carbon (HCO3(-)) transporter
VNIADGRLAKERPAYGQPAATYALPFAGLAMFTFFLVTARWAVFTEIGIVIAMLGLIIRPQNLRFPAPAGWALAFLLWALVTSFFALSPEMARAELLERFKCLIIFFVVINTLRTPRQLRFYIFLVLLAFMIYPARGALTNYVTGNTLFGRVIWNKIYSNPNDLGAMTLLTTGLALAIATVKTERLRVRWAVGLCVPVMIAIMLLTQSRGVFIGLIVGFAPVLLAQIRKRPSFALPVIIAVVVTGILVPATVWHRFEGITKLTSAETVSEADPEGSAEQRFEIEKTAWRIFKDHPLRGIGIGCYDAANALYSPELGRRDAHNTYLNLAAELGLPGLLLWLGLVGSVLLQVRRYRRSLPPDAPIQIVWIERAIVGFLVAGFFGSYSGITMFYLILGTLWAVARSLPAPPGSPARFAQQRPMVR